MAVVVLIALSVVFGAMLHHLQRMLGGNAENLPPRRAPVTEVALMAACTACLLLLGLRLPAGFADLLQGAVAVLQS